MFRRSNKLQVAAGESLLREISGFCRADLEQGLGRGINRLSCIVVLIGRLAAGSSYRSPPDLAFKAAIATTAAPIIAIDADDRDVLGCFSNESPPQAAIIAVETHADRVALPGQAGGCDPLHHLSGRYLREYAA